jgi:hypothetical protein
MWNLWARNSPRAIRQRQYQFRFSVNVWAAIIENIIVGPDLLPARGHHDSWFSGNWSTGTAWRWAYNCEVDVVAFDEVGAADDYVKYVLQWLKATCPWKREWRTKPTSWLLHSLDLTALFLPITTPQEARLCNPSQHYRRPLSKISSRCDNGWYQHVETISLECRVGLCGKPISNAYCNYRLSMLWSFDSLCHLSGLCISKINRHRTQVVEQFQCVILKNIHTMESLWANFVSLCVYRIGDRMKAPLTNIRDRILNLRRYFSFFCLTEGYNASYCHVCQ